MLEILTRPFPSFATFTSSVQYLLMEAFMEIKTQISHDLLKILKNLKSCFVIQLTEQIICNNSVK